MNKVRIGVLSVLSGMSAFAHAEINFTGELVTANPIVSISSSETPVAHVKDFEIRVDSDGIECNLVTDSDTAEKSFFRNMKPSCLFEWTDSAHGLTISDLKATGLLSTEGSAEFGYQISVVNEGEKTILITDSLELDIETPVEPVVTKVQAKWGRDVVEGVEQVTYNRSNSLFGWEVALEERPYPQMVTLDGYDCTVKSYETTCSIIIDPFAPGVDTEDEEGRIEQDIFAKDQKSYFNNTPATDLGINWDYRGPKALGFAYNADSDNETKDITIGELNLTLAPEEAVLVVASPHIGKDGDWWMPSESRIKLKTELGSEHNDVMEIHDTRVRFDVPNFMYRTEFYLDAIGEPELVGDNIVYRYSTDKIPDGKYNAEAIAEDSNRNGDSEIYSDNVIDRYAPDIQALIGDRLLREGSGTDLYFLNDLTFAANGGWPDGTNITSVKVNGVEAGRDNASDYVTQLHNTDNMTPGLPVDVIVTAVDGAGNEATKEFNLSYMSVDFQMYNKPETLFSRVEETSMYLTQTGGMKCFMSGTKELAVMISGSLKKGCTVEFSELPNGLSPEFTGSYYKVEGASKDEGEVPISYKVVYHNKDGSEAVAFEDSFMINVIPPDPLELNVTDYNMITEGVYSIAHNGRLITRYELETVPARVNVDIENPFYTENEEISQRRMNYAYTVRSTLNKKTDLKPKVWDVVPFKLSAYHVMDEYSSADEEFDLVVTPSTRTRAYAEPLVDEATTLDTLSINARVGVYDRSDNGYEFDLESMGDWKMHLAYKEGRDYVMLTEEKELDENGLTNFSVAAKDLFDLNRVYYAVANAKSPVDGFEMQIVSTPKYTQVLKGTAVEGTISARTIEGPIPLSLLVRYEYDSVDDMRVAGELKWEYSPDGINWTSSPEFDGDRMYRAQLEQPQEMFVRVNVDNKVTGIESVSEAIKIIAYDVASISIEGPSSVYAGQDAVFKASISDLLSESSDGVYEWSTDGVNWVEGGETFIHNATASYEIEVRHRLDNTSDDVGENGYAVESKRVTLDTPQPLMVSLGLPRSGEVGDILPLESMARNRNTRIVGTIISEIVTPTGDVIDGNTTEYLLTEDDAIGETSEFTFRAWVEGFKDETYAERTEKLTVWKYEMPVPVLALNVDTVIAPTTVTAQVSMASIYAPGIEFTYDWSIDEDVFDIESVRDKTAKLTAKKAGMHLIKVTVSDNRGNKFELSEFLDVMEADPMTVEVTKYSSNEYLRAPLVMTYRVSVDPGHPRDYSGSYEWFVDGVKVPDAESSFNKVELNEPGDHEVKIIATSRMGQVAEHVDTIIVAANQPPICEPELSETSSSVTVITNCSDTDGKIIKTFYQWGDNEETSGSTTLRFSKTLHPTQQVDIRAIDDSGEEVTATIGW
jgi:hypothetical protein